MKLHQIEDKIGNEKIYLKMPTLKDAEKIFMYCQNKDLLKFMEWNAPKDINEVKKHINERIKKAKRGSSFEMCIYLKETDELIGSAGLVKIDLNNEYVELGYWVAKPFWHRGIATEATSLILAYVFNTLKANNIVIMCNPKNIRSRAVAEKLKFHLDGILRSHVKIREKFTDKCSYSLLRKDYRRRKLVTRIKTC
jgi:RimJ/RimL family protein N-acetyltransferase